MTAPVLLLFCAPNPLVTIPNFLFSYLVAIFTLPISILSTLVPSGLEFIFNYFFIFLYQALMTFDNEIQITYFKNNQHNLVLITLLWIYLITFNYYLLKSELRNEKFN